MGITYLLLVHPTGEEKRQGEKDNGQRGLQSSQEEGVLASQRYTLTLLIDLYGCDLPEVE